MGVSLEDIARLRKIGKNIIVSTAQEYNIPVSDIIGRTNRRRDLAAIRRLVVQRMKQAGIGAVLAGRLLGIDQSTVWYHHNGILSKKAANRREKQAARAMEMR